MLNDLWTRLIAWSGTIVSPDWAALVALIPVLLLLVVLAFIVITAAKWANAGPARRGPGRRTPLAPDGSPIQRPSIAPIAVAAGGFVLAYGLVAGGPALAIGFGVAAVGLAWWTLDIRRERHPRTPTRPMSTPIPGAEAARGAGEAPTNPAALALGWSLLLLAAGLVFGGIVLGAGIVACVVGAAWWARELFAAPRVVTALAPIAPAPSMSLDDTAASATAAPVASPAGPAPGRRRLTPARAAVVVGIVLVVGIVVTTSKVVPDAPGATTGASAVPPVPSSAYQATLPPADATLAAQNITFVQTTLTGPAGRPFTVAFDNRDNVPHNLEIRDAAGKSLFLGDIVTGPKIVVYEVPSLPAGQYPFVCTVHPGMTGTLTVK